MPPTLDNTARLPLFQHANLLAHADVIAHGVSTRHGPQRPALAAYIAQPDNDGQPAPPDFRVGGRGMTEELVARRRAVLCAAIGLDAASAAPNITAGKQVHGTTVARVGPEMLGQARNWSNALDGVDGLITDTPDLPLITLHADCPAVFVYDPTHRAIGLAHSGRRGTIAGMPAILGAAMAQSFGSRPADLIAAIGPGIGPCCYVVGAENVAEIEAVWGAEAADLLVPHAGGRFAFDLWEAIRRLLRSAGIPDAHIENAGLCTRDHHDTFFSYRADGPGYGNFGAMLAIRPYSNVQTY